VLVKDHAHAAHGTLEFSKSANAWLTRHTNVVVQQMADCYLHSYFSRRGERIPGATSSV
jgi:hypothetical protein